jgi:hypothetical protein
MNIFKTHNFQKLHQECPFHTAQNTQVPENQQKEEATEIKPLLFQELEKPVQKEELKIISSSKDIINNFLKNKSNIKINPKILELPKYIQEVITVNQRANIPLNLRFESEGHPANHPVLKSLNKEITKIPIR